MSNRVEVCRILMRQGRYELAVPIPIRNGGNEGLPEPDVLAREIVEDLEEALEQFSAIADELKK